MASCATCHKWNGQRTNIANFCSIHCLVLAQAYVRDFRALQRKGYASTDPGMLRHAQAYEKALKGE